ncbi:solute carrier family 2, facilitated glucose transporter member 11 isoform X19 [Macaca fascicularis]|uniref:solute carrier family 2, facilitated glucose transporter member 11 isoform X19 n=1 Tax=Macaca fascicularis TaxID=9541 RepID=UPI003D155CC2
MEDELEPSLRPRTQIQGRILLLTICAAGIGGTFQFGYNLSIINAPTSKSLLVNNIFVVLAAILFGFSRKAGSFEMIMLGRLLVGVSAGVSMNIQPMYLGESAPKELRGAVAMSSAIFTALGIVMGQVVGLRELLGDPQAWPLLLASCLVPGVLQLASLPLVPESPRYLLIDCGDTEACLAALRRLRGSGDLARELEELEEERAACQGCRARRPWELFQHRALRRQVTSLVVLGSAMELCGNDLMYAYASSVFQKAGVPEAKVQYATIGTGSCELLMAIVSVAGVDEGWRVQARLTSTSPLPCPWQSSFPWTLYLAVACIFASILSFGIGPAGVTGILATELFDQMARPAACMVCGALMWIMLFLVSLGFPFIMEALSHFLYVPFLGVCVCGAIYTGLFLPETKGKTLQEISEELHRLNFPRRAQGPTWRSPEVIQSTEL